MKALIYLLVITSTTLSITAQRIQEPLVELSKPDYSVSTKTTINAVGGCFGYIGNFESSFNKLSGTSMDVDAYKTFGILTPSWEPVRKQVTTVQVCDIPVVRKLPEPELKKFEAPFSHPNIIIDEISVRSEEIIFIDDVKMKPTLQTNEKQGENIEVYIGGIPGQFKDITELRIAKSTVKGTVMDAHDNPAIATIIIYGENLKDGFTGAQTDEQGSFGSQVPPGNYKVKISQQGHIDHIQDITVELDRNLNLGTIRLKEVPVDLTGYIFVVDHNHSTTSGNTCVTISQEEIKRIPFTMSKVDVVEALNVKGIVNCDGGYDHLSSPADQVELCNHCICVYVGGIPVKYGDIVNPQSNTENINHEAACNCQCHDKKIEITETIETVATVVTCFENLSVMGDESDRSAQGPFTGLEGHNFTEEPAIIYPNPVKDILHVKSTDPITVIEILNIHGEVERVLYINETMDVSELAAGNYFARIHFENIKDVQIERIIIVK